MDGEEEEVSATAALLAEDDGADAAAVVQARFNVLTAVRRRARAKRIARRWLYRGSIAGRRGNKRRESAAGVHAILRDYFSVGGCLLSTMNGTSRRGSVSPAPSFRVCIWRSRTSLSYNNSLMRRASFKPIHCRRWWQTFA